MNRTVVFPGSFDPITVGHEDILNRASRLFDIVIMAIGENIKKETLYPLEERVKWLKLIAKSYSNVEIDTYSGLTVDYCLKKNARYMVRGLRNSFDFHYERSFALMSNDLSKDVETVFLVTSKENLALSSTNVRDIVRNKGDISPFIPKVVRSHIKEYNQTLNLE